MYKYAGVQVYMLVYTCMYVASVTTNQNILLKMHSILFNYERLGCVPFFSWQGTCTICDILSRFGICDPESTRSRDYPKPPINRWFAGRNLQAIDISGRGSLNWNYAIEFEISAVTTSRFPECSPPRNHGGRRGFTDI